MDMDNSGWLWGGGIRELNGNGKNTINFLKRKNIYVYRKKSKVHTT